MKFYNFPIKHRKKWSYPRFFNYNNLLRISNFIIFLLSTNYSSKIFKTSLVNVVILKNLPYYSKGFVSLCGNETSKETCGQTEYPLIKSNSGEEDFIKSHIDCDSFDGRKRRAYITVSIMSIWWDPEGSGLGSGGFSPCLILMWLCDHHAYKSWGYTRLDYS